MTRLHPLSLAPLRRLVSRLATLARAAHAGAWWFAIGALALGVTLSMAPPRVATPQPMAGAGAAAAARAEVARWVRQGRSQPEAAVAGLGPLLPRLAAEPGDQVEALLALGELAVVLADGAGLDRAIEQLGRLDAPPKAAAWARAAADALRARQLERQGPVARAARLLDETIRNLPEHTPDALRLRLLGWHAEQLFRASKLEQATVRYQEAIALADATAAPGWQRAELRSWLAHTLQLADQSERARPLNRVALALAQQAGDDRALAFAYKVEGILDSPGELSEVRPGAEQAMRQSLAYARKAGSRRDEIRATANLADMALRKGDYAQALDYAERALPLAREVHDISSESVALANAGFARIMLGQHEEGLRLARASMAVDERAGQPAEVASTQNELGHYLEKAGRPAEAYAAYGAYRRLAEQVFRSDLQGRLGELQEAFDQERRQRELALLDRESRFQQVQLVSDQLTQWLWVAGAVLGALLLALGSMLLQRLHAGNRQLEQTNAQLAWLSERDVLTGLANRHALQLALQSAERIEGTLLLLDIDHFKQINDRWGHAAGDLVLVEIARRLSAAVRAGDLVVRWGGEEFLLWLRTVQRDDVQALVSRTLEAIGTTPVETANGRIAVTASIGFATFPIEPGGTPLRFEQALELVDTTMYLAKANGRNRGYGLQRTAARTASEFGALSGRLESAWRDGTVELVVLEGPREFAEALA
jgi:diguanylate cyclase (GGDEF)-like protein